ncbi:uncharacterized protein LOC100210439 [Hydra vulgaris]|uniref:Uncharacterized protein LOC100210439 n=1 Tax=Hydra vulgaris TaxID=6087 RepID=A0ABM4D4P9_HYDVU
MLLVILLSFVLVCDVAGDAGQDSNSSGLFQWEPISNKVCFHAKGDLPGIIYMHKTGFIVAIKLVYRSGAMKCVATDTGSNWGCDDNTKINVVVADSKKEILFPSKQQVTFAAGNWYTLPGTMSVDEELVLNDFCSPAYVSNGDHLFIWWGEDHNNYSEGDNSGHVCVKVYALFQEAQR